MSNTNYIAEQISNNKNVYLHEDYQDAVIKIVKKDGKVECFAKLRTGGEYPISHTTNLVADAILGGKIITEQEYKNF